MSIGSQLKHARQQKGISLEEAAVKTRIQAKFLDALENDNFSLLPNALYLKGFLKNYALVLGLDPDTLISQLQQEAVVSGEKQVIVLKSKELPPVRTEKYFKKSLAIIISVIVAIGLAVFLLSLFKARPAARAKKINVASRPVQKKTNNNKQAVVKAQVLPVAKPQPAPAVRLTLFVMAKKACHLTVKADSRLLFDGFLLAGATDQWQTKNMFDLAISDGSAIELMVNGRKTGPISKGAKRDIIITKDGIRRVPRN